ncbi:hypothetical protein ACFWTE_26620 [Nocardiopsis sp. NPDC058631]|uniref:hypothetical protein n=1 Tax=Nocardiopsis sp. NPDC058631 TaxID=3346566 RepID=UPI00364F3BAE
MRIAKPTRKVGLTIALASMAVILAPASPAAAADWDRSCYGISAPYKAINEVMAQVTKKSGCSNAAISLQRDRWWGWETVDEAVLSGSSATTWYNCSGTGTYTYKMVMAVDYGVANYESAERRITC